MSNLPKVLVCEDEDLVREVAISVIEGMPGVAVGAADGEEAVERLRGEQFDLLLCDKNLPGMSGIDVAREARKLDPNLAIVIVTAYASRESAEEALGLRVDDYLVKPVDIDELEAKVREVLKVRQHRLDAGTVPPPPTEARTLVVLEPDEPTRATLEGAIEALGWKAMRVDSVSRVLSAIRLKECQAVVCDVSSLEADEASACFLKAAVALAGDLPFVVVSPVRSMGPALVALNRGARHVLTRPLPSVELTSAELNSALTAPPRKPRPRTRSGRPDPKKRGSDKIR